MYLEIWDYTGEEQFSFLWEEFIKGSNLILIVTDSTLENVEKSKFFLEIVKSQFTQANIAVIGNKQDLDNALEPDHIKKILKLKTYPLIALDQEYQEKLIGTISNLLENNEEFIHQLKLLEEREVLMKDFEYLISEKNYKEAFQIIEKITTICTDLEDDVLRIEFYEKGQEINKIIQETKSFKETTTRDMPLREKLLKSLIENYMNEIESVSSVIITDREGVFIISESKTDNGRETTIGLSDKTEKSEKIGKSYIWVICPVCKQNKRISIPQYIIDNAKNVVTFSIPKKLVCEHHFQVFVDKNLAVRGYQMVDYEFDRHLDKIINEINATNIFFNVITTEEKKVAYCSKGPKSLLTTIASPSITDVELRAYSEHIAEKIELIMDGFENVDIEIPQVIKTIAKTKGGELPKGEFYTKIILVGAFKVGKTSLINRFVRNTFEEDYHPTIGVDLSEKVVKLNEDTRIQFIIWDIAGQKKSIASYRKKFYKGANFALIVIDRTHPNEVESIKSFYNAIKDHVTTDINFILVGNKSDLLDEIITSEEDIKKIADHYGFHSYILTSAKTGENVNDAFLNIAYTFLESV